MGITFRPMGIVNYLPSCSCGWVARRCYTVTDTAIAVTPEEDIKTILLQLVATEEPHSCSEAG